MTEPAQHADRPFVVLSLDGGGTRGVLTARVLLNLEQYLDKHFGDHQPIGRRVDLVAGTSTGGVIALALGTGRPAADIVSWYEQRIPSIFAATGWKKHLRSLWGPRHRSNVLRASLVEFFGERTLEDSIVDLCVVSVALRTAQPRIYKTGYLTRNLARLKESMVDVALATSAAPTYFEPTSPALGGGPLIDGGLCANNPVLIAFTDALQFERATSLRGRPAPRREQWKRDVLVISIGTGKRGNMPYNSDKLLRAGKFRWALPAIEIFSEAQSITAHLQASFLMESSYMRINPTIGAGFELDDPKAIEGLRAFSDLDRDTTRFIDQQVDAFRCQPPATANPSLDT